MLNIEGVGLSYVLRIRAELEWLKENHPDKLALIKIVESHLRTIDMAGCMDSNIYTCEIANIVSFQT